MEKLKRQDYSAALPEPHDASSGTPADESVQHNRRVNLRTVIDELQWLGLTSSEEQIAFLGKATRTAVLASLKGGTISSAAAEEIEWAMQKPRGWLDKDHRDDPLG